MVDVRLSPAIQRARRRCRRRRLPLVTSTEIHSASKLLSRVTSFSFDWPMSTFSGKTKVNLGVLGHIDSGKTALCGALSTILSTAALDKNPQVPSPRARLRPQFPHP